MYKLILILACLSAVALAGCADENPLSSAQVDQREVSSSAADAERPVAKLTVSTYRVGGGWIKVMSRNLYLGASINPIVQAAPEEIPIAVAQAWSNVLAIDFVERAQALADEIARTQPHLVGLQEVAIFRLQTPGDYLQGNPQAAEDVVFDYLELLLVALEERGMHYRAVASNTGTDIEVPMATNFPLDDLRFTDREVILARSDVRVSQAQNGRFSTNLVFPLAGMEVAQLRGWASVETRIAGQRFRFVSTHLETAGAAPIQVAQGAELVELVEGAEVPVVLVGDFNSRADGSGTSTYGDLVAAGFIDVWQRANPQDPGLTCCHDNDLRNETADFNRRIDQIFVRPTAGGRVLRGKVQAEVVGEELQDRTTSGLWPSDHAGVWARFRLQPTRP